MPVRRRSRLVRLALRFYPARFRERYSEEMLEVYEAMLLEERQDAPRLAVRTTFNLLASAVLEHLPPGIPRLSRGFNEESTAMDSLWQDIRYAFRKLARNPLFAAVSILTLAIGIGATTAAFHMIDSYLLSPPMRGPDGELVRIYGAVSGGSSVSTFSYPTFEDVRDRSQVFGQVAAHRRITSSIDLSGSEAPVNVELVSGEFFALFGGVPQRGRLLGPDDNLQQGAHPVLVVSDAFWKSALGRDPGIVGSTLNLSGTTFSIVGVATGGFSGTHSGLGTDLWVPMMMHNQARPTGSDMTNRGWGWLTATAALKQGISIDRARADLDRITAQLIQDYPRYFDETQSFALYPAGALPDEFQGALRQILAVLSAIVLLVLLVGCTNIAGVLMGRVVGRRREIAVRVSLGSSRLRLIRLWVSEALILSLSGGLLGLVVALATHAFLTSMLAGPELMPGVAQPFEPGAIVLAFSLAVSVLTGLVFGIIPAIQAGRVNVCAAIKEESGSTTAGSRGSRFRAAFVTTQVAVAVVLLVGTGLLVRTLQEADAFDPGFETADLLLAPLNLRAIGLEPEQGRQFTDQLMKRLQSHSDIVNASFAMSVPLSGDRDSNSFIIPGYEPPDGNPQVSVGMNVVGPGYFETLGISLVQGQGFKGPASLEGPTQVVVNETMAARYWPEQDPLGQQFQSAGSDGRTMQIVGVASDINYYALAERPRPFVYGRAEQFPLTFLTVHVRTRGEATVFLATLKSEISALLPSLPVRGATTFEELRRTPLLPQRLMARLTLVFSSMALLLTAVGIYGVVAQAVAGRTQEIGVRMALGGDRTHIRKMILRRVAVLVGVGLVVGLASAGLLLQLIEGLLFGVSATDPVTYGAVALLLVAVALAASWTPLRRATRVDPVTALRYQ